MTVPEVAAFLRTLPEFHETPAGALDDLAARCEVWSFHEGDLVRFPDESETARLWVGEGCLTAARPEETPRYIGIREEVDVPAGHWIRGQTDGWYLRLAPRTGYSRVFRQSRMLPVIRMTVPLAFVALFAGFGFILTGLHTSVPLWALWLLPVTGMAFAAAWAALIVLEWKRSFVALGDRTLVIRSLDLGARSARFETLSADHISEAVFTRKGWAALLGLATLEIETDVPGSASGARFVFSGLPPGCGLLAALEEVKAVAPASHTAHRAWAAKAERAPELILGLPADPAESWFRRHVWTLLKRCLPWLGWSLLVLFVTAWAAELAPRLPVWAVGSLAALVPIGRIGWEVWDWSDDKLGVMASSVVLVRKRPLWLGETRQEVPIDQVEQVGIRQDSLAGLVFDFGMVTVRLGLADPLEFTGVGRPEAVRQAILARRKALADQRDQQAAQTRFDEVSDIVEAWEETKAVKGNTRVKP